MLGWMLKRGESAPVATEAADTTDYDQPDTPAPVFAARALKSAIFGTPAVSNETASREAVKTTIDELTKELERDSHTPVKTQPQGILLTPGTGTSRPKRVSFGREFVDQSKRTDVVSGKSAGERVKRSRLAQALENSRRQNAEAAKTTDASKKINDNSDDDWEEAEDDENYCNHDITLDLNEPRSQSGQYWKESFYKYQEEAKVELGKLLKYKQLAKSYAQEKDAEAIKLAEMLRDEQQKVIAMEKKIVENASHIVSTHNHNIDDASSELMQSLSKQTAQAVQYRQRVQELESQMEQMRREKGQGGLDTLSTHRRHVASPRTQKTLVETQRELQRARNQLKELSDLREQVSSLKEQLRTHRHQDRVEQTDGPDKTRKLKAQLALAQAEARQKDEELAIVKKEFDQFREESRSHDDDARAVLERAHSKITELKKEVRTLKANGHEASRPTEEKAHPHERWTRTDDLFDPIISTTTIARNNDNIPSTRTRTTARETGRTRKELPRDRFQNETEDLTDQPVKAGRTASNALVDRPNLQRPRWQPFVPRSPRNRAYLGEMDLNENETSSKTRLVNEAGKGSQATDLSALARSIAHATRVPEAEEATEPLDLLNSRFARLGGPATAHGNSTILANTSKSVLPPERRAAAIARIEQRMAEKKSQKRAGKNKENVRPRQMEMEF